jgi:hypothetical protein
LKAALAAAASRCGGVQSSNVSLASPVAQIRISAGVIKFIIPDFSVVFINVIFNRKQLEL